MTSGSGYMGDLVRFPHGWKVAFGRDDDVIVIYYNTKTGKITKTGGTPLSDITVGRDFQTAFATLLTGSWRKLSRSRW
jgi:hypothetical protein